MTADMATGPLSGFRVVELGQLIAGPFAAMILGYFGAEVIKVEPLDGDPIRRWRHLEGDTSLWWRSLARNKRCIAVDLRTTEGQAIVRKLVLTSDVLLENFRPGTLERNNLDPRELERERPELVIARVSGYGQTGPLSQRPGYASVCEAFGGLRHLTGVPGEPSVRANLSLGDSLAGLQAALGVTMALLARSRDGRGQVVDVAIYEAVFGMLESVLPEYDRLGVVRGPSGATITGVVPTGTYRAADGMPIVLGANGEAVFARLCEAMRRPELATDPRFRGNENRVAHQPELEEAVGAWVASLSGEEVLHRLEAAAVPCSRIYDAADIAADPHYRARAMIEEVDVAGPLALPAVPPKLTRTPGATRFPGPELGADTAAVLGELGYGPEAIARLRAEAVIA